MSKAGWSRRLNEEAAEDYRHRSAAKAQEPGSEPPSDEPIRIVVDESGTVRDVLIARDWRDAIPPAGLGRALLDAVRKALGERIAKPSGSWLTSSSRRVTDKMSDASVKDGDKSDWTPKP